MLGGVGGVGVDEEVVVGAAGVRQRPRGELSSDEPNRSPRRGLQKYLSRFDDAMKLRGQLANEKPAQDGSSDLEELDSFRLFRMVGSILLAVFVRIFVCKYLVSPRSVDASVGDTHFIPMSGISKRNSHVRCSAICSLDGRR